ncbi:MAG: aromatic hydrocarbon degradation protein [Sulfurimonas sp.]|nr:MAG: aromatic hydrocarbon degradation protein [Sulfurimonas sp.]
MKKIVLLSLIASSMLMAGGYKIPETSLNGVALSAANIAHNKSADAAYYNPANMVFMEDTNHMEVDLTYIGLDPINYKGTHALTGPMNHDIDSKSESFFIPSVHYVSGKAGETRIGLSICAPGGLSKRWDDMPAVYSAEEFTLQAVEINPTVAIPINDKLAVAFGFRIVHSEGIVKSTSPGGSRDMTADSIDYGYNFALAYKPTTDLEMAFTYRSQINLTEEGNAKLYSDAGATKIYDGGGTLTIPLPAFASFAVAYTLPSKTTVEFVYERNMWSAYKNLDFGYDSPMPAAFDDPIAKDWKDTNAFRLGITQELDNMTLMAGMVYDETPVPEKTVGFELPDSNSFSVSLGGRYQVNDKIEVGLAALYSMRESRTVKNDSLDGEFSNGNVLIVSTGVSYKF